MIAKKNGKANLENKRFAFFQIGLIVSGSLCLAAFEFSSAKDQQKMVQFEMDNYWSQTEPMYDLTELTKPMVKQQPQMVMIPDEDVTITSRTLVQDGVLTNEFVTITDGEVDCYGCDSGGIIPEDETLDVADIEPSFPGGAVEMMKFLKENLHFPQTLAEMGLSGTVYVHFVVNKSGAITQITCSEGAHADFQKEAIRVVKSMPQWIPGEQAGKKVNVRYTIPVSFTVIH